MTELTRRGVFSSLFFFLLFLIFSKESLAQQPEASIFAEPAEKKERLVRKWDVSTGYRIDEFDWNVAADSTGNAAPNITQEASWKHLDVYQVKAGGELLKDKRYVLKGDVGLGAIGGGRSRDSEYAGHNRSLESRRTESEAGGGSVFDISGGLGYRMKPSSKLDLTPLVGYSYHRQDLRMNEGIRSVPGGGGFVGGDSKYVANWAGPWLGFDADYSPWPRHSFLLNFEYHWLDYTADGNWDLRSDLDHPLSFEHGTEGHGSMFSFGYSYAMNKHWAVNTTLGFSDWNTEKGVEKRFTSGGGVIERQLNEVNWDSVSLMVGLSYYFDELYEDADIQPAQEPVNRLHMSGSYRLAFGFSDRLILNDSNPDFQSRNSEFISGERLMNTFDPAIYDQFLYNINFTPAEKIDIYTQVVADPWSWVGTTGDQVVSSTAGGDSVRYNLKYWGANNSTLREIYRSKDGGVVNIPRVKNSDGHTTPAQASELASTGNSIYNLPAHDVDTTIRPFRKAWVDYDQEDWHARVFALADQSQALTSDDPLKLTNNKTYWQPSPWLERYVPPQQFSDGSLQRGYYSDFLAQMARDSQGNRLVVLKGASMEADLGKTYVATTVAAPYSPWDEEYLTSDTIPGAIRFKNRATDKLTVGGTYTFRRGNINKSLSDNAQAAAGDFKYKVNEHVAITAEMAGSNRDKDMESSVLPRSDEEGFAYKAAVNAGFDHPDGHTDFALSYAQMDKGFDAPLSDYRYTRDDAHFGQHITFKDMPEEMERHRIGEGIDTNRRVIRAQWKEKGFKDKFVNLFDVRTVHRNDNGAFKEAVLRDEATYRVNPQMLVKGLFRWHGLPETTPGVEPFMGNFYFPSDFFDTSNGVLWNPGVLADRNASRMTFSGGIEYVIDDQWTAQGTYERTNNIPDFPRGLLYNVSRDPVERVDGVLLDRLRTSLYGQTAFGLPPYEFFDIFRERVIYRPDEKVTVAFHAAQNSYKLAAGIDDNVTHQGVSVSFDYSERMSLFFDYTHSQQVDVPHLIASNFTDADTQGHHNFYASLDYKLRRPAAVLRAEYGAFGLGAETPLVDPYSTPGFSLPTLDTEHLFRVSLNGDF